MQTPILSVSGLHKKIRGRTLVKDISFEINPGEIFGFLGPNGAGKTTTIRMLVGLIRPSSGRILIDGHNLKTNAKRAMQKVGCIVENPDLYPYLSGYENLLQLARMQGRAAVGRIQEVARLVRLEDRLHDKVRTYSLGMRQRLGIAQALLNHPKLLILDEPTNGLDPAGIREMRDFLRELAGEGLAIFVSSHLLAEVQQLCHTVAIVQDGRMIQAGSVDTLLRNSSTWVNFRVQPTDAAVPILKRFAEEVEQTAQFIRCRLSDEAVSAAVSELTKAGCEVHEVTRQGVTLEDVFLQMTGGDSTHGFSSPR